MPKNIKYSILILFSLIIALAQAQNYKGTIGKHPIYLALDTDHYENRASAFYFYESSLENIVLDGKVDDTDLILYELYSEISEKKELFRLQLKGDKIFGTWQNGTTILDVTLTKTNIDFEQFKKSKIEFVRDSISTYDDKELVWFTEKYSKKWLFRLGNGFTKAEREFMNPKLDSIHTEFAMLGLDCKWADISIAIEFVSDQYISFSEYSNIYCGGAHPSYNYGGYNFDYKNKKQFDKLADVFPNLDYFEVLKNKYEKDKDLDAECEYFESREYRWKFCQWVFTKEGISITPSFPYAMTPCKMGFPLTYEEILGNE